MRKSIYEMEISKETMIQLIHVTSYKGKPFTENQFRAWVSQYVLYKGLDDWSLIFSRFMEDKPNDFSVAKRLYKTWFEKSRG